MNRYDSPHYPVSHARSRDWLDVFVAGPYIATHIATHIAAEERHAKARQWAAIRSAAPQVGAREPGPWRRWFGARLVRAGTRLQGLPPRAAAPTPAAG
jgi:hypothetical protein